MSIALPIIHGPRCCKCEVSQSGVHAPNAKLMETKGRLALDEKLAAPPPTQRTVIFVGYARLPQSLAVSHASPVVSVELEADMGTGIIPRAAVMGIPGMRRRSRARWSL